MSWLGAVMQLGASHMQQDANVEAANAAAKGNKEAQKFMREAYLQQQAQLAPWRQYGAGALGRLGQYYGLGGAAANAMQSEPLHTYQDSQIQRWLDQNQDHPRYQEVLDKFGGGQQAPVATQSPPQGIWGTMADVAQQAPQQPVRQDKNPPWQQLVRPPTSKGDLRDIRSGFDQLRKLGGFRF